MTALYPSPLQLRGGRREVTTSQHLGSNPRPPRRRPPCEAPDPLPGQRPALRAQIAGKEFRAGPRGRRGRGRRRAEPAAATQRLRDGTGRTRGTRVHRPVPRRAGAWWRVTKTAEQKIGVQFAVRPAQRSVHSCPRQAPLRCIINNNTARLCGPFGGCRP